MCANVGTDCWSFLGCRGEVCRLRRWDSKLKLLDFVVNNNNNNNNNNSICIAP